MASPTSVVLLLHKTTLAPVTSRTMFIFAALGMLAGLVVGYITMGTLHAFLEMGVSHHHGHPQPILHHPFSTPSGGYQSASAPLGVVDTQKAGTGSVVEPQQTINRNGSDIGNPLWPRTGAKVHTLFTSNGSPYVNFQSRIMYATYKLAQGMPGGECLSALTRILHRTVDDELMEEIPTFRVHPLTPKCDTWCEFPVADRPNAVHQFFDAAMKDATLVRAPWVLMIETDYVWMTPLQGVPAAEKSEPGWAFPYGYIVPTYPDIRGVMREMFPESRGPLTVIPNTGPAPVLMRAWEWVEVVPDWERLAAHIEATPDAKGRLGWVREMYAFSIACALQNVVLDLKLPPVSKLMAQPPADHRIGAAALLHYTWGSIFKDTLNNDAQVWAFDKRFYTDKEFAMKVPQLEEPIPYRPGLKVIGNTANGIPVTPELVDMLRAMVQQMNRAIQQLPSLEPCPATGCIAIRSEAEAGLSV